MYSHDHAGRCGVQTEQPCGRCTRTAGHSPSTPQVRAHSTLRIGAVAERFAARDSEVGIDHLW
jgi:hypothetical protein